MEVFVINRAVFFAIIGLLCSCSPAFSQEKVDQPKPEFRAMWVSAWENGCLTPEQVDETIELARKANLNALFIQVRKAGDSYYKSAYEPKAENLRDPNFDMLAYAIKKGHASGLEIHAWINTYKIWQGNRRPKSPDHVFNRHPEWINRNNVGRLDKSGQFQLDPGIREVQDYTAKIYLDVVKKYDVDGVHYDYVRYYDPYFGYSDLAVARYNKEKGTTGVPFPDDPQWCQWRRDRVTDLVRQVYDEVKAVKPWVKVTGSVVCSQAMKDQFKDTHPYNMLLQDWERWTREGIIDAVVPMNYKTSPQEAALFSEWTAAMVKWAHGRHAYNGITVGNTETFINQIRESREKGTNGIAGFAFNGRNRTAVVDALRNSVYKEWVPTPAMPWKPARKSGGPITATDPKALYEQAAVYSGSSDFDTAIILLERAIEKDINYVDAYFKLGRCYLHKGMKAEAAESFRQTLEIDPNHKDAQAELLKLAG